MVPTVTWAPNALKPVVSQTFSNPYAARWGSPMQSRAWHLVVQVTVGWSTTPIGDRRGEKGLGPAEGGQHLLHARELDPRAAQGPAARHLQLVQPPPVRVAEPLGLALPDEGLHGLRRRLGGSEEAAGLEILQHDGHGLGRVGLVGPDDASRSSFDPARA